MEELLCWMMVVTVSQVILMVQGWVIFWRCSKINKRLDTIDSELKQFRGVARLRDIPSEQRNGIHNAA
jgi:hypothetical protein